MFRMSRRHAIERTHHPEPVRARRDVQVDFRRGDVFVSENFLDGSQIGAGFEQVRCEGVPQRMTCHPFLDSRRYGRPLDRLVVDLSVEVMASSHAVLGVH